MATWITDSRGNRASVERWGSEEAAKASLERLSDCSKCSNCLDCSGCSDCFGKGGSSGEDSIPAVPVVEGIHTKVLEAVRVEGAFDMRTWHSSCGTTHCRAGHVVMLAGEKGRALEDATTTCFAAMQIYKASDPENPVSPVRFIESNEVAMRDIERMAELESQSQEHK